VQKAAVTAGPKPRQSTQLRKGGSTHLSRSSRRHPAKATSLAFALIGAGHFYAGRYDEAS